MSDRFSMHVRGLTSPTTSSRVVTPNDNTDLESVARALHANGSGNVALIMADDSASVVKYVVAGVTYPWRVKRVLATGTTVQVVAEY